MKKQYEFILVCILIIFLGFMYSMCFLTKESFENKLWSDELLQRFQEYQNNTFQNSYQFNMNMLQKQAEPQEVQYLLKNNKWPWTDKTKQLYLDAIRNNPIVKIQPQVSLDRVMKIYNENAMLQLLSWNTKEGDFLLQGIRLGNRDEIENDDSNFERAMTPETNIRCDGDKGMLLSVNDTQIRLKNEEIPLYVPGFQFGRRGVCNPCIALSDEPNYSCPFVLNVDGDSNVSSIWETLWS